MDDRILNTEHLGDEELLRIPSIDIDFQKDDVKKMASNLRNIALQNRGFSLALPQINIHKKMIYIKTFDDTTGHAKNSEDIGIIMINPVVENRKGKQYYWEMCMSVGYIETRLAGYVCRPYSLDVSYYDETGNYNKKHLEGFPAIVISHEYDHLFGILHTDYVDEIFKVNTDEQIRLRKKYPRKVASKTCEYNVKVKSKRK